ncbi:MAG TPA: hypothetical protein VN726_15360 [Hanamia sp.]|nr:hypothetical protein [Hanamia sp.]
MSTPLEIVVTGNVDGAKSSLQTVQNELGKTALAAQKTDSALSKVGGSLNEVGTTTVNAFSKTTSGIGAAVSNINSKLEPLERHLHSTFHTAFEGATEAGAGMSRLAANVMGALGPLGLLVGAFAIPKLIKWVESLKEASEATKALRANLDNMNEVMANANKKAGEQISTLKLLYQAATDVNLSMKDRLAASKELQKEFPEYFGNIKTETILNGDAKKSYDDLTTSIINNAKAKAAKDKIDELEAKRLDSEFQREKIRAAADNQIAQIYKNGPKQLSGGGSSSFGTGTGNAVTISIAEQIAYVNKSKNAALALAVNNEQSLQNQEDFLIKFAGLPTIADVIEKGDKTKEKSGKKTNPFEISLKDLEDNYKKAQALLVSQYDANTTDAKKNTTAINDLLLKAQADFLEKKLALIRQYGKKEGDVDLEIAKTNKALIANQIGFNIEQINTLPKVQGAPNINFKKATSEKIDPKPYYVLSDAIQKNIKLQQEMKELLDQTTIVLNKTLGPAFDALFTNILDGSGNAFKAFGDAIKQMLIQLGAAILKAALFSAILSVISGGASNVAGGKSFMDLFGPSMKSITGFASGGAISGPGSSTSDSILARVSKGEYIMNASAVSKFGASFFDGLNSGMLPRFYSGGAVGSNMILASNNHVFIPEVTLKGQDLIIAFNRANQRASRNG